MAETALTTTHAVKARAMLPVHVGGGRDHEIDPLEYVVAADGWFYRLDIDAMLSADSAFAAEFVRLADQTQVNLVHLRDVLRKAFKPTDERQWRHKARASATFLRMYKDKLADPNNQLLVQCMPLAGRCAYIPGSSIKGALRTAILDSLARKAGTRTVKDNAGGDNPAQIARSVEGFLLAADPRMHVDADPLKYLKVGDAVLPPDATTISLVKNWNPRRGEETGVEMLVETVNPGTEFTFNLQVPAGQNSRLVPPPPKWLSAPAIWRAAWNYLVGEPGNLVEEAGAHYEGHNDHADACINAVMEDAENAHARGDVTYLRVGRFSHLECITYSDRPRNALDREEHLSLLSDRTHPKGWGKTRNLVDGRTPLGVLRLELVA